MNKNIKKLTILAIASTLLMGCAKEDKKPRVIDTTIYIVKEGDTLERISKKFYGSTVYYDEIADFNDIKNPDFIRKGQKLYIPNDIRDFYIEDVNQYYRVKKGDSLYKICKKFYNDTSEVIINNLANYNNIYDPNVIYEGQIIELPSYDVLMSICYTKKLSK